jgi:hypothetical protein
MFPLMAEQYLMMTEEGHWDNNVHSESSAMLLLGVPKSGARKSNNDTGVSRSRCIEAGALQN